MVKITGRKISFGDDAIEEFVPSAAWSEDSLFHILLVDLPDFSEEDLKLDYESQHITVSGLRLMNNKKYKYFEKTFKAPENSEIEKATGNFEGGIFYVTIPKKEGVQKEEHIKNEIGNNEIRNDKDGVEEKPSGYHEISGEDEKNKEERKKGSCVDEFDQEVIEKWGKECSVLEKAMKMVSTNKDLLVTAVLAFSIGILVSRKF